MNTPDRRTSPLEPATHARYRIRQNPLAGWEKPFEIIDDLMGGQPCALPDDSGHLRVLQFRNSKSARAWLILCHQLGQHEERRPNIA